MCGLHGIITNKRELNGDDFIRSAFTANMLRGTDSSGIATINTKKNLYDWQKLPVSGNFFVQDKAADSIITSASNEQTITMCHVRAATVGSVSMANAHPFIVEQEATDTYAGRVVIGMHNGTLQGWSSQKNAKYYSVDSEWAINHIAEEHFDAFEDIRGAFCFVWWDSDKPSTLNIARNSERTLYVAMLKSGGMAYASEAGMLYWLLERHRIEMDGPILELEAGYWYKFNVLDPTDFDKVKLPAAKSSYYPAPVKASTTPTAMTSYSTMSKVSEVVESVKKSTTQTTAKHNNVSQAEHDAARELNLLGKEATFTPYMEWADGIEGTAVCINSEASGTVRGYDTTFTEDEEWTCKVIGAQDDGTELVLILSAPTHKKSRTTVH